VPRIPARLALSSALLALACGSDPSGPAGTDDSTGSSSLDPTAGDPTSDPTAGPTSDGPTTASSDPTTTDDDSTDDGSDETGPPPVLGACDSLAGEGVFEDVTPPEVKAGFGKVQDGGGAFAFSVDPVNQGTIYLGTLFQRVWKSTDCGATWVHISTGALGEDVDSGMNWTFGIDPVEPDVVYTNSGYGTNGLYKSRNGGVDWEVVWPPAAQPELAAAFTYNFANVIAMDPDDHQHILLTFHEPCLPPHNSTCIAETFDAGTTWALHDGRPEWNGGEGQVIFFLDDDQTWLWGSQTNGFWRSGDAGATWEAIEGMTTSHLQGSQLLRSPMGTWFVAGSDAIWRSPDGLADTWTPIPDTGPILGGLISDGTTLFASTCYFGGFCEQARYLRSSDDGATWSPMDIPPLSMGGSFGYDPGHGVLYSSNLQTGFWRVVVNQQ
jgi:hypothetical protein